ncbi:MAG: response regulator, partial [Bacteroidetes bacterium]|nr:response regulator [Bacteroidota bacterium]
GMIARRNVDNLLNLTNQILDLRKLEFGSLHLNLVQDHVISFLRYGTQSFESLAASRSVELVFESDLSEQMMDFDPKKLLQIQTNLISNAIKFTPKEGIVKVSVSTVSDNQLQIQVKDTGRGIPSEKLPMIFDRFYQVDQTDTREGEGTGIGLALTKELVELMEGKITVKSEVGEGSVFTVLLPIRQNAAIKSVSSSALKKVNHISPPAFQEISDSVISSKTNGESPSLLIIEDNPDIVEYLYACLEDQYELFSAPDGQAGIEIALEQVPDLIITDVMMPRKNGYEVCEALKLDERTSHIPIVMLTARADQPSRMEGFKRGADVYLAKPFDKEELLLRLANLFELRKTLQKRYQNGVLPVESEDLAIQTEDKFLSKVHELVKENLDDHNYRGESI